MTAPAPITSYETTTLAFGDNGRLPCLYVVVDPRQRPDVSEFLANWSGCCDLVEFDARTVRRPAAALVGIALAHRCEQGPATALRIVLDAHRDRRALEHLAATEAIVVGTTPYGAAVNSMAAYGVAKEAVLAAIAAAEEGLRETAPAAG